MAFTIPTSSLKKEEEQKISFSNKDIEQWIVEGETINSSICALLVGDPKTGKSGVALDCRTPEEIKEGKKIFVIELNSDNGCKVCKKEHWGDDPTIVVLDPRVINVNLETGDYDWDYEKSLAKIKALLQYLKVNREKLKIKAIVLDGADVLLGELCESVMRMQKSLDVTGGVNQLYWKIRNVNYYNIMNMLFTIDCDKYIITHFKKGEGGETIYDCQTKFPDKVSQIIEFRKDKNNFYAKLVADRRKITDDRLNKEVVIAENTPTGIKWKGYKL